MAERITLEIVALLAERDALRRDLARIEAVIEYARRKGADNPTITRVRLNQSRRGTLAAIVRRIVAEKGPITSREVVRLVQEDTPTARAGSIRSTCSLLRRRGIFKLHNEKWSNADVEKRDSVTVAAATES